jgi:hypothetical protein
MRCAGWHGRYKRTCRAWPARNEPNQQNLLLVIRSQRLLKLTSKVQLGHHRCVNAVATQCRILCCRSLLRLSVRSNETWSRPADSSTQYSHTTSNMATQACSIKRRTRVNVEELCAGLTLPSHTLSYKQSWNFTAAGSWVRTAQSGVQTMQLNAAFFSSCSYHCLSLNQSGSCCLASKLVQPVNCCRTASPPRVRASPVRTKSPCNTQCKTGEQRIQS